MSEVMVGRMVSIFKRRFIVHFTTVVYEDKSSTLQESTIEIRTFKNCSTLINIFLIP